MSASTETFLSAAITESSATADESSAAIAESSAAIAESSATVDESSAAIAESSAAITESSATITESSTTVDDSFAAIELEDEKMINLQFVKSGESMKIPLSLISNISNLIKSMYSESNDEEDVPMLQGNISQMNFVIDFYKKHKSDPFHIPKNDESENIDDWFIYIIYCI